MKEAVGAAVILLGVLWLASGAERPAQVPVSVGGKNVAVTVFPQCETVRPFQQTGQSRLEGTLRDNGATILDEKKANELKNVLNRLDDPAYFVTAEDFVEAAQKYGIQRLARLYLKADVAPGLADYFMATAQADMRIVDNDAKVSPAVSTPMGAPGSAPSDGLTRQAAIANALQRAVDDVCIKLGLDLTDPVQPAAISLKLAGPLTGAELPPLADSDQPRAIDHALSRMARLENQTWRVEEVTCTARDPSGNLGAVGGYIKDTDFRRKPPRLFGSRIHLVDLRRQGELNQFECHEVGYGRGGTCAVLDCLFASSWRYLLVLTGKNLFLWDTERGRLMSSLALPNDIKAGMLGFSRTDNLGSVVTVAADGRRTWYYSILRDRER